MTAKVSPMECSRWTPSSTPRASGPASPSMGGRTEHGPGADDQLVVGKELLVAVGVGDEELATLDVDAAGHGVEAKSHARSPRDRRWSGAPGCASG